AGRVAVVHTGRQVLTALLTVGLAAGLAVPLATAWSPGEGRIVLRDLVSPPLDVQDYPSPLSSFRHYTTDLAEQTLITVSDLPEGARVRLAVMDTYDGVAFGMSDPATTGRGGYVRVGTRLPEVTSVPGAVDAELTLTTEGLLGPWVPLVGVPRSLVFTGSGAAAQQEGLHLDQQAVAALTTAATGTMAYVLSASISPVWSDGQLPGVPTPPNTATPDTNVPDGVAELAQQIAATEQTSLGKARAVERFLSREGFFSNSDTAQSRPGHRADRLARMVDADQMIGDDEQYSTLMALMLHTLGIPARVVMGAHTEASGGGPVELRGSDVHAWVEVEFEGVGWAHFDPTPPKAQVPQTDIPKPRSVPRPPVLQPPEPPEEPAELPPSTADRPAEPGEEDVAPFPWGIVLGASGALLLVLGPLLALVGAKWARRRRRRDDQDPTRAVEGSWLEIMDLARDAGVHISTDLTRQESAWVLSSSLWHAGRGPERAVATDEGDAPSRPGDLRTGVPPTDEGETSPWQAGEDPQYHDRMWEDPEVAGHGPRE
ncbi:MAG: transglutaminase-like domain-containing protein, partial [Propionibacterium sp.]|nr:transglutaminase-like domain-containing protein [Propionibacterium sp.]